MQLDADIIRTMAQHLTRFRCRGMEQEGRKRAAVAIALTEHQGEASFVLTRRAPRLSSHAGQWALPGGRLDDGETPEGAALREMEEEIGVALSEEDILGRLDDYPTRSGYLITPVVVLAGQPARMRPNPQEVASIHHIPLSMFQRPGATRFLTIPESDRPVIQLWIDETQNIHAPTAAVLHQFAEVALNGKETRVDHLEQPVFAWR